MYAVHLSLVGKLVGDFLLVIIELFSLGAFVLSQFTHSTDRQTDGRTDKRTLAHHNTAPASLQRGKHDQHRTWMLSITEVPQGGCRKIISVTSVDISATNADFFTQF